MAKGEKNVQKEKKEVVIKAVSPIVSVEITPANTDYFTTKSGEYHLVALKPDGTEKIGSDFSASKKLFESTYKKRCAPPYGTSENPAFMVKKNP